MVNFVVVFVCLLLNGWFRNLFSNFDHEHLDLTVNGLTIPSDMHQKSKVNVCGKCKSFFFLVNFLDVLKWPIAKHRFVSFDVVDCEVVDDYSFKIISCQFCMFKAIAQNTIDHWTWSTYPIKRESIQERVEVFVCLNEYFQWEGYTDIFS